MRRLSRIVFNTLTVLSLVLALGVAGLWVRSYTAAVNISKKSHLGLWIIQGGEGVIGFYSLRFFDGKSSYEEARPGDFGLKIDTGEAGLGPTVVAFDLGDLVATPPVYRWGDFLYAFGKTAEESYFILSMPCWALEAVLLAAPVALLARRFRRQARSGVCASCGYDLRATPDRCPECGAIASTAA